MSAPSDGTKWRNTADGVLWAVDKGGPIQPSTLERLLALLREKTDYEHHVAVEVLQGTLLRTIDNENDAHETIRRLDAAPKRKAQPGGGQAHRRATQAASGVYPPTSRSATMAERRNPPAEGRRVTKLVHARRTSQAWGV